MLYTPECTACVNPAFHPSEVGKPVYNRVKLCVNHKGKEWCPPCLRVEAKEKGTFVLPTTVFAQFDFAMVIVKFLGK